MKPEEPQSNTDTILPTDRRLLLGCKCTYCTSSDKLPLPDWWNLYPTEKASFLERCFLLAVRYNLCLVAYGRPDLDEVWFTVQPNHQEAWEKSNERIIQRLENQNIVGGLLLATVAVFITTEPPRPELVQYVKNLPYIFLLISFSLTIGSILSGSAIQACLPHVQVEWFCKVGRELFWFDLTYMIVKLVFEDVVHKSATCRPHPLDIELSCLFHGSCGYLLCSWFVVDHPLE
ncbi:hypothetical protein AX16_002111 [Volvariella volvacea WC 439]|nr:hypothetical protein AX16_002111 [Volvariella volvacea WC 439]